MTAPPDEPAPGLGGRTATHWLEINDGWRRLSLTIWIGAIIGMVIFSLLPSFAPSGEFGLDKILHTVTFFSLALLPHAVFKQQRTALIAALSMIPLGCPIELAQAFIPGRYGDLWDAAANSAGVFASLALGSRFRQFLAAKLASAR